MTITQLSVFLENRPGRLSVPCRELANAGINIITLSLADTQQFGILRFIVRDWEKAKQVLEKGGHVVRINQVVAVEVPDRPGGMAGLLEVVEQKRINIEYMYAFTCRCGDKALVVFRFDDPENAVKALEQGGLKVVRNIESYELQGQ